MAAPFLPPPSLPPSQRNSFVPEKPEDRKPTERKPTWRTAEERRMSDLTRVLEWLERRQGKKKMAVQELRQPVLPQFPPELFPHSTVRHLKKPSLVLGKQFSCKGCHLSLIPEDQKPLLKEAAPTKANRIEDMKTRALKKQGKNHKALLPGQHAGKRSKKDKDVVTYRKLYGTEMKGKRLSMVPGNYKDTPRKSETDTKDANPLEYAQRSMRRQSVVEPMLQDAIFGARKSTLLRDWAGKSTEAVYERKLKSLIDKGIEPRMEAMKMLKPEEVLSCRYLRLSKNNIRTLLKLCKDAGMNVDIHPHMVEADIDAKKVFNQRPSTNL